MMRGNQAAFTLKQLAQHLDASTQGADVTVNQLAGLQSAQTGCASYCADKRYLSALQQTQASVIVTSPELAADCPAGCSLLLVQDPQSAWLKLLGLFAARPKPAPGIHPSAVVPKSCDIAADVSIGPYSVLGEGVTVGAGTVIAANCQLGDNVVVGASSYLHALVTLYPGVSCGERVILHSGVVIGADGFGNHRDAQGRWHKIPQLGAVVIGNNVEIGANSTIDCGALENSVIADGVRIDNMVYLAHNVSIGADTAIAAGTIVAGTVSIGARCMLGGGCSIGGHLEIVDDVILTATSSVSKSISKAGVYSSGQPVQSNRDWHKSVVHYRNLERIVKRISLLEKKLEKNNIE